MKTKLRPKLHLYSILILTALTLGLAAPAVRAQNAVTAPEEFFGFQLGSDRNIARWDKIVEYFRLLEKECGKLKVINMGPSTMGHPFLVVIISSPENLADLDRLQEINANLSDPRGVPESEVDQMIRDGKAVMCQSMSLHATEIGGTQMAPELTYDMVSRNDEETLRILDNVLFFLIPSFNPDGQIMVTDWYRESKGTDYEGTGLPWLYHKYAGHDNNRDGDFLNLTESKYAAEIMYRDWLPQAYIDHHHMGSYGARLYIPPYCDPIRPYADPLIWRELSWYGAHLAYKLEEHHKTGILNDAQFPGWGHFGWHWIMPFHNIAGMLTESASTKLATPLYIHPEQLTADTRQFPEYEAQSTFPHPWEGGWWTLRDIVEQQKISAWAMLDLAARNKDTVLRNAYLKAERQIQRGIEGDVKAYVVPAAQHDPLTAVKMINTLLESGLEIKQSQGDFTVDGRIYKQGSFLISLAQPKMGLIRNLLGRTFYPDNEWTRAGDGTPLRPYDLATHTMNEFMGVTADPVGTEADGSFQKLTGLIKSSGTLDSGAERYVLDGRLNDSFKAVNLLLDRAPDAEIFRSDSIPGLRPGDFIVSGASADICRDIAETTGVDFEKYIGSLESGVHAAKQMRVGMYKRYWGGNMDEGWTRLLLEKFDFPYVSLMDEEVRKGQLKKNYDVIILPSDSAEMITGELSERYRRRLSSYPARYQSGIGEDGVESLKEFVKNGGVLVALADASEFAIDTFELNIRNAVEGIDSKEFFCPGSTLKADFDNTHPLAYGMPAEGLVLYWASPVFEIIPGQNNEHYQTVVRYQEGDILRSGWLIGEDHIVNRPGMVTAGYGDGEVILIGFHPQLRSQTHGTFKLLFNALIR
jgi:hypothetical protein